MIEYLWVISEGHHHWRDFFALYYYYPAPLDSSHEVNINVCIVHICRVRKKILWVCFFQFSPKVAATLKQFQLCGRNMPLLQNCAACADKCFFLQNLVDRPTQLIYIGISICCMSTSKYKDIAGQSAMQNPSHFFFQQEPSNLSTVDDDFLGWQC